MKSLSTSCIDSTLNINTTYFLSKGKDTSPLFPEEKADIFEICAPTKHFLPSIPLKSNPDLIGDISFTVLFMIIFAFIRLRGKDLFPNLLNTLIKRKKAEIILNEGISSNLICYVLSLCLSLSILSVTISFIAWHDFLTIYSAYIFIGLFLYHFLLLAIVRLLGWTFNSKLTAYEIIVNIWTYHIAMGLLISPFILSTFFVQTFAIIPLIKIVIFSLALLMIVKIIRWIEILFSYRVSILYMILYLCALEIMPLLVLYKVVA